MDEVLRYITLKVNSIKRKLEHISLLYLNSTCAVHSGSRKGNPNDSALVESFYRKIKRELIRDAENSDSEQAQQRFFYIVSLTITQNDSIILCDIFLQSNLKITIYKWFEPLL